MARVKSIRYIGEQPVYNMEVEDHHNFSVNGGLIVHNCGYGIISHHTTSSDVLKDKYVEFPEERFTDEYDNEFESFFD